MTVRECRGLSEYARDGHRGDANLGSKKENEGQGSVGGAVMVITCGVRRAAPWRHMDHNMLVIRTCLKRLADAPNSTHARPLHL